MFDLDTFLQTTHTEIGSTEYLNPPDGAEAVGIIKSLSGRTGISEKDGPNKGKPYMYLDIQVEFTDPIVTEAVKRPAWTGRYGIPIDLAPGSTETHPVIDWSEGMNVKLGRLREQLDQRIKGQPWAFSMLIGNAVRGKLKHRIDDRDGRIYCDVVEVNRV